MTAREATGLAHPEAEGSTIYEPGGCLYCGGRGFLGRLALFEMIPIDEEAGDVITRGGSEEELNGAMTRQAMPFLRDDALGKLIQGETCWGDVQSVVTLR
jgi:type IV pilus assembly protein PilB